MDFEIPEELKMIQRTVRDFVTDQLKPLERVVLGHGVFLLHYIYRFFDRRESYHSVH